MTDPTAHAAKLLPCPSVICPSHHPEWEAGVVASLRDETLGYRVTCAECDSSTGYYAFADEAVAAWNTRPQPAPPVGEPDLLTTLRIADEQASVAHDGIYRTPTETTKASDAIWNIHNALRPPIDRLILAARPKDEDTP